MIKIENLDKALKESLNTDQVIENLEKPNTRNSKARINYYSEKRSKDIRIEDSALAVSFN